MKPGTDRARGLAVAVGARGGGTDLGDDSVGRRCSEGARDRPNGGQRDRVEAARNELGNSRRCRAEAWWSGGGTRDAARGMCSGTADGGGRRRGGGTQDRADGDQRDRAEVTHAE
uniref:Uncharacterized protein n=1 Tax=Arundo donax TaxID=35708 RepID=A0A0A9GKJ0_ARUDO